MKMALACSSIIMAQDNPASCRDFFPSFTIVHALPRDFVNASKKGVEETKFSEGLFRVSALQGRSKSNTGVIESLAIKTIFPFNELVLSANAVLSGKTSVSIEAQVRISRKTKKGLKSEIAEKWSPWYKLGKFKADGKSSSFQNQEDGFAKVDVDVLKLRKYADAFRYRIILESSPDFSPCLRLVSAVYTDSGAKYDEKNAVFSLRGNLPRLKTLNVPARSQMGESPEYARDICSPVALSMVLDYWGVKAGVAETASGVYDAAENIYGNWFFNTAYAGLKGFDSYVTRMNSVSQAQSEIASGRPIIASIAYGPGELKGSPIKKTPGHLVVIRGFDKKGNFIVNDSAAPDKKSVKRTYKRAEFARAWIKNKFGTAYMIVPRFSKRK